MRIIIKENKQRAVIHLVTEKKPPDFSPRAFVLEEHVQRVSTEPGTGFYSHIDSEFLLDEPFADSRKVVLVQERHII